MTTTLTPDQERFIQTQLQTGKYQSAQEVLEVALRLLDECDRANTAWIEEVREKIDSALEVSTPPVDGETFINQILERFQQSNQA
jgi:antitoxin ParD1/3/4